jgi:two-component system, OmpR family, alkaline phosphatase synthesis response regulator PhoP
VAARILIVDDERDIATLMTFVLEREGHKVDSVLNGLEALGALGVEPLKPETVLPDLVLMDVMMPVLDGIDACKRIAAAPHARRVPIVVMTGKARETRLALASVPNVVGLVEKPFEPSQLREAVMKALPPASPEAARG